MQSRRLVASQRGVCLGPGTAVCTWAAVRLPRTKLPPAIRAPLVAQRAQRGDDARDRRAVHVVHSTPGVAARVYGCLDRDLDAPSTGFDSIADALSDLARGKFVVVLDDEDRENEGDLIICADKVTSESMAFLVEHSSGVVCISMLGPDLDRLRLPLMVSSEDNAEAMRTAFTVTVDLQEGVTTGISAADRASTIRRLADPAAVAADFRRPGHIFPLRYRDRGVLVRPGHTEAAVDLARLARSYPAGVLCEIVNRADGSMARTPELLEFARQHGLKCITIADLIRYRLRHEPLVVCTGSAQLDTRYGRFTAHSFSSMVDDAEHLALVLGDLGAAGAAPLVHAQCARPLLDVFSAQACGARPALDAALSEIARRGAGALLYLHVRGRASGGIATLLKDYSTLAQACDVPAAAPQDALDLRDYCVGVQMVQQLGGRRVVVSRGAGCGDVQSWRHAGLDVCGEVVMEGAGANGVPQEEQAPALA